MEWREFLWEKEESVEHCFFHRAMDRSQVFFIIKSVTFNWVSDIGRQYELFAFHKYGLLIAVYPAHYLHLIE